MSAVPAATARGAGHAWSAEPLAGAAPLDRVVFAASNVRVVGDLDGNGAPDMLTRDAAGPGTARITEARRAPASDVPRWTLDLVGLGPFGDVPRSAGDLDGDGRDDLLVDVREATWVVFGRAGGVVTVPQLSPDVARLGFMGAAPVGDANGDGRDDLAFVADEGVRIVFTPAAPRGKEIAADDRDATAVRTTARVWSRPQVVRGPGGSQLVFHGADGMFGLPLPSSSEGVDLERELGAGRAWHLTGTPLDVTPVSDSDGDGRQDLHVITSETDARLVVVPPLGTRSQLAAARGYDVPGAPDERIEAVDVGDQDGDRVPDVVTDRLLFVQPGLPFDEWPWQAFGALLEPPFAAVPDADGDGKPEVVVAYDEGVGPEGQVITVTTWGSRALAAARQRPVAPVAPVPLVPVAPGSPSLAAPASPKVSECSLARWYRCESDELQALRLAEMPTRGGWAFGLAATPEYRDGSVVLRPHLPHGAQLWATAYASPWRGRGGGETPLASTGERHAVGPTDRYALLEIPLSLPLRRALERDGRLRMRLDATRTAQGRVVRRDDLRFVVVTRRPARQRSRALRRQHGSFGSQRLVGTPLSDELSGASGNDVLRGAAGADVLTGGTGNDRLYGDGGADTLDGSDGDDRLFGGPGDDLLLETRFGDDVLDGGPGDDELFGMRGHDTLRGGAGDDVLAGGSGPDVIWCGPGEDIVFANFAAERRNLHDCEHVYQEPGVVNVSCSIGGTAGSETVLGTEGPDVCEGRDGDDDVEGRGGDDVLRGGDGNDRIFGRFGDDVLEGGDGDDELEGGRGRDRLDGGDGDDRLNGGFDPDVVFGGAGDDRVVSRGGGTDRIDCGPGHDVAIVDSQDRVTGCERVERSGRRR